MNVGTVGTCMNIYIKYSIMLLMLVAIIASSANAENDTNDTIKFSIKSKFLTYDKDWNNEIIRINITLDRLGRLQYKENYYLEGSKSLKFHSSSTYFDDVLTNKSIYFNISRQRSGKINNRKYNFIESVIIFDNKIIFNKTVNIANRNRLDYGNMIITKKPIKDDNKDDKYDNKNIIKIGSPVTNKSTDNMKNYTQNVRYDEKSVEMRDTLFPINVGFEIIAVILIICIVYFKFKRH